MTCDSDIGVDVVVSAVINLRNWIIIDGWLNRVILFTFVYFCFSSNYERDFVVASFWHENSCITS